MLEVPTRRGLEQLERAAPAPDVAPSPAAAWGPRKGLFLLGTLIFVAAVGFGGYLWWFPPQDLRADMIRGLRPADTLEFWQALRRGIHDENDRVMPVFLKEREKHRFKLGFTAAAAILGLAIAGVGFLVNPRAAAKATAESPEGGSPPRGSREKSGAA